MDIQAAADGEDFDPDDDAAAIIRHDHQALRKAFVEYRELMDDAASERATVAHTIAMQFELHFAITSEVFYPAVQALAGSLIAGLKNAQQDIAECVAFVRRAPHAESAELDSTMVRLMELGDVFFCRERELLELTAADTGLIRPLGARMLKRRQEIAGSVEDLESRS